MSPATNLVRAVLLVTGFAGSGCGSMDMMPAPPSDLMAIELLGGAHLTWKDNSDNEASFMIERKVGAGVFAELITVPFDTTQHHDEPLVVGETYVYRVMAMPKSGGHPDGRSSNEVTFKLAGP